MPANISKILPIETIAHRAFDSIIKTIPGEPTTETKFVLTAFVKLINGFLKNLVWDARRKENVEEWLAGITIIEQIQDNVEAMIQDLENIGY